MGNHADRGRGTGVGGRRRREVAPAGFESVTPWRPRKKNGGHKLRGCHSPCRTYIAPQQQGVGFLPLAITTLIGDLNRPLVSSVHQYLLQRNR